MLRFKSSKLIISEFSGLCQVFLSVFLTSILLLFTEILQRWFWDRVACVWLAFRDTWCKIVINATSKWTCKHHSHTGRPQKHTSQHQRKPWAIHLGYFSLRGSGAVIDGSLSFIKAIILYIIKHKRHHLSLVFFTGWPERSHYNFGQQSGLNMFQWFSLIILLKYVLHIWARTHSLTFQM